MISLVGKQVALAVLVFLMCVSPVFAQEAFMVDTPEITNPIRVPFIYQDKITIHSLREQVIIAEIKCGDDISCQWASFAFATGRETSIDLPFEENETYPLFVEVVVPEEANLTQYSFDIVLSSSYQTIEIPYALKVGFNPNPLEQLIMLVSDTCSGIYYEFPNSRIPPVTCVGLVLIFITVGIIIIAVKIIRSKG